MSKLKMLLMTLTFVITNVVVLWARNIVPSSNRTEFKYHHNQLVTDKLEVMLVDKSSETLMDKLGQFRFVQGFLYAVILIIGCELGDKTFFIAAVMSMKQSRLTVFVAAMAALILMTLLSVCLGLFSNFVPRALTHFLCIFLFIVFGVKMLHDGYTMTEEEAKEEFEEVNKKLNKRETDGIEYNLSSNNVPATQDKFLLNGTMNTGNSGDGGVLKVLHNVPWKTRIKRRFMQYMSLVFIETFMMTFIAEWGDRSQVGTIAMAANHDVIAVTLGAIVGHCLCTGLACIGGRFIAQMISVKAVTMIGGVIFIFFAFLSLYFGVEDETKSAVTL